MALETSSPSLVAVLDAYSPRRDEFRIACRADIVVAWEGIRDFGNAREAVISSIRWLDGIVTNITGRAEGQWFEWPDVYDARTCKDRC